MPKPTKGARLGGSARVAPLDVADKDAVLAVGTLCPDAA